MTELEAMKLLKDKQQAARRASTKLGRMRWEEDWRYAGCLK